MSKKYSLLSMEEPSNEQLQLLMADVLVEVKLQNQKALLKSQELFDKELERINVLKQNSSFYKNGKPIFNS
jgi:hypothetical protein